FPWDKYHLQSIEDLNVDMNYVLDNQNEDDILVHNVVLYIQCDQMHQLHPMLEVLHSAIRYHPWCMVSMHDIRWEDFQVLALFSNYEIDHHEHDSIASQPTRDQILHLQVLPFEPILDGILPID